MNRRLKFALIGILVLSGCTPQMGTTGCDCGISPHLNLGNDWDLIENVGDRVFYDFNKSTLSSDTDATLGRQAAWLAKYPKLNVLIAGNTDERGTETYNLALGQRRANAARDYLVAAGVAPNRIQTISYGKGCPIAAGHDQASYQQNRTAITSVQGSNPQNCH
jgi:peptidoglycan-associated lipoprotein